MQQERRVKKPVKVIEPTLLRDELKRLPAPVDGLAWLIRRRAYELWEAAGRPDGRAVDHWLAAEQEVVAREIRH
ncbi:MAG: DUF2934 domain-containing protein [Acidobacteriota bacterium]